MKHISKYDDKEYEISASRCPVTGEDYDIINIIKFHDEEQEDENGNTFIIESIGMYFGDYDYDTTEIYIKEWYKKRQLTKSTKE